MLYEVQRLRTKSTFQEEKNCGTAVYQFIIIYHPH